VNTTYEKNVYHFFFTLGNRAQSEYRFRSSTLSLNSATGDTTSHLPLYTTHTSSSMTKLREDTTITPPVPTLTPSCSILSLARNPEIHRVPLNYRSKNMTKSRSILSRTPMQQQQRYVE
jgi:hypothetical protein